MQPNAKAAINQSIQIPLFFQFTFLMLQLRAREFAPVTPGLAELLAYARTGDTLAVVRLDRLGRSLVELLAIVEQIRGRGIALLSLEEKIDTSSAAGELIFHVFGSVAHFERRLIAERTKDGIAAARAKGKIPGRRPLDPEKAKAALKLVEAGMSPTEAARQLGLGRATVYREMALVGLRRTA